jgi:hypothetical protein
MRLSTYVAIAGAVFLGQSIAAPLQATEDAVQRVQPQGIQRREDKKEEEKKKEPTAEERERLKHFHEPGYVCCGLTR